MKILFGILKLFEISVFLDFPVFWKNHISQRDKITGFQFYSSLNFLDMQITSVFLSLKSADFELDTAGFTDELV